MGDHIDIVFDGPPGPESGRFVEVEDSAGRSIRFGEWVHRADGYWALRIPDLAKRDNPHNPHIHQAGTMTGKHIDECSVCGHDIRHPIHSRIMALHDEAMEMLKAGADQ